MLDVMETNNFFDVTEAVECMDCGIVYSGKAQACPKCASKSRYWLAMVYQRLFDRESLPPGFQASTWLKPEGLPEGEGVEESRLRGFKWARVWEWVQIGIGAVAALWGEFLFARALMGVLGL
jgi:hypothetical protein